MRVILVDRLRLIFAVITAVLWFLPIFWGEVGRQLYQQKNFFAEKRRGCFQRLSRVNYGEARAM